VSESAGEGAATVVVQRLFLDIEDLSPPYYYYYYYYYYCYFDQTLTPRRC
jgi:hypothetical protein